MRRFLCAFAAAAISCHAPRGVQTSTELESDTAQAPLESPTLTHGRYSGIATIRPARSTPLGETVEICCDDTSGLCWLSDQAACTSPTSQARKCADDALRDLGHGVVVCID